MRSVCFVHERCADLRLRLARIFDRDRVLNRVHAGDNGENSFAIIIQHNMPDQHVCAVAEIRVVQEVFRCLGLLDGDRSEREGGLAHAVEIELVAADECFRIQTIIKSCDILSVFFKRLDRPAPLRACRCKAFFIKESVVVAESELSSRKVAIFAVSRTLHESDARRVGFRRFLNGDLNSRILRKVCAADFDDLLIDRKSIRSFKFLDVVIGPCGELLGHLRITVLIRDDLLDKAIITALVDPELRACERIAVVVIRHVRIVGFLVDIDAG